VLSPFYRFMYIFGVYLFWPRRKGRSFEHGSYLGFLYFFPTEFFSWFFLTAEYLSEIHVQFSSFLLSSQLLCTCMWFSLCELMIAIEWRPMEVVTACYGTKKPELMLSCHYLFIGCGWKHVLKNRIKILMKFSLIPIISFHAHHY